MNEGEQYAIWEGAPAALSTANMNASLARQKESQPGQTLAALSAPYHEVHCVALAIAATGGGAKVRAGWFHSSVMPVFGQVSTPEEPLTRRRPL